MMTVTETSELTLRDLRRDVSHIVRRALSWSESRHLALDADAASAPKGALLARWKKLVTTRTGDPSVFDARLESLGLRETDLEQWLQPRVVPDDFIAPEWAVVLDQVVGMRQADSSVAEVVRLCEAALQREDGNLDRPLFLAFVAPFIAYVFAHIGSVDALEIGAKQDLALAFARELSWTSARTVAHELKKSKLQGDLKSSTPQGRYQEYITQVLPASRDRLFAQYPVLARMLATLALQFAANTRDIMQHLQTDVDALTAFTGSPITASIAHATPFLSDFHNGGRSVWKLDVRTTDGRTVPLFHKPRSLAVDIAWASFIDWLSQKGHAPALSCAKALDRGEYGWSSEAVVADCNDESEVRAYYRRQGVHTALITALGGQDFHAENFIAAGQFPIPIDLEGLLAPIITAPSGELAKIPTSLAPIQYSGAGNLMLPYFRRGAEGVPMYTASGVAGTGDQPWPRKLPKWASLNTDELHLTFQEQELRFDESVPTCNGQKVWVDTYRSEIVEGIRSTWKFLAAHKDEISATDGPLSSFRGLSSRTLFRDTQQYADLMFWTTAPDILESGAAYDVALETLAGAVPFFCNGARFPEIVDLEKRAFWQRDIPMAETVNDGVALHFHTGETFSPILEESAWHQAIRRLGSLRADQSAWQSAVAESLLSMTRRDRGDAPSTLLDAAIALGNEIDGAALRFDDEVSWLTFVPAEGSQRVLPIQSQPWDLTSNAGNAIFLAELARVTGEGKFAELAKASLRSAERTLLAVRETAFASAITVSAFTGSFGLVYALLRAGKILGDEQLIDDALRVALSHPDETFQREANPDWLTGVAGTLAVLSALNLVRPHGDLVRQAAFCRSAIDRAAREDGMGGWQVPFFERPLVGMAHGSSGIAAGLLHAGNLHQANADQHVLNAFAHERQHFRRDIFRWPNLQHDTPHYMTGWCAGPAGFGMARLLALRSASGSLAAHRDILLADLQDSIAAASTCAHAADHHACCGDAGTIMFLAMAGKQLDRDDLSQASRTIANGVLKSFTQHGVWRMQSGFHDRVVLPGLLSGQASIGMSFLAAIDPSTTEYLALC